MFDEVSTRLTHWLLSQLQSPSPSIVNKAICPLPGRKIHYYVHFVLWYVGWSTDIELGSFKCWLLVNLISLTEFSLSTRLYFRNYVKWHQWLVRVAFSWTLSIFYFIFDHSICWYARTIQLALPSHLSLLKVAFCLRQDAILVLATCQAIWCMLSILVSFFFVDMIIYGIILDITVSCFIMIV